MRGKISGQAVKPLSQEYQITITLSLEDWQSFRNQIRNMDGNNSYPAFHIVQGIDDCITHARNHFEQEIKSARGNYCKKCGCDLCDECVNCMPFP